MVQIHKVRIIEFFTRISLKPFVDGGAKFNDIWMFYAEVNHWTWVGGDEGIVAGNSSSLLGPLLIPSYTSYEYESDLVLWLFGGIDYGNNYHNYFVVQFLMSIFRIQSSIWPLQF